MQFFSFFLGPIPDSHWQEPMKDWIIQLLLVNPQQFLRHKSYMPRRIIIDRAHLLSTKSIYYQWGSLASKIWPSAFSQLIAKTDSRTCGNALNKDAKGNWDEAESRWDTPLATGDVSDLEGSATDEHNENLTGEIDCALEAMELIAPPLRMKLPTRVTNCSTSLCRQ